MSNVEWVKYAGVLFLMIVVGCGESHDGDIGSDIIDSPSDLFVIDTLSVKSGTVYLDSVITQTVARMLYGSYEDPEFGKVTAKSFIEILPPEDTNVSEDAEYVELTLTLYPNYFYGDFDAVQQIYAYEVLEDIEPIDENEYLYSSNHFDYAEDLLGSIEFTPSDTDSIVINLSDEFGIKLFNFLKNEEPVVSEEEKFLEFFNGIVLSGEQSSSSITGFDLPEREPKLVLKYTEREGEEITEKEKEFPINTEHTFSSISGRKSSPISRLSQSRQYLSSNETDQVSYIQSGVGLVTRIDFPTLRAVLQNLQGYNALMSAELYIKPIGHTYAKQTPLPDSLQINIADEKNNITAILEDIGGADIKSAPLVDEEFNMETYYKFDITTFIQSELDATAYPTGNGLIISPSPYDRRSTVDRIMIGDRNNRDYDMQLRIYLLKL